MGSVTSLEQLYTSAPIVDYDEDGPATQPEPEQDDEMGGPGVATLGPEAFDAAILAALIAP
jgi:hypothetical protein